MQHGALLALAVGALLALLRARPSATEVFDEACYELGKQWVYEAKDMLLCDRTGRRININKFCKAHLTSSQSGRLIIDNSRDEQTEPRKQTGHFPELCLPGQRSFAVQAPWLCTCVMHKGRHRWECVVPEDGAGRGGGEPSRRKRSVGESSPPEQHAERAERAQHDTTVESELELHNASTHATSTTAGPSAPGLTGHGRAALNRHPAASTSLPTSTATASLASSASASSPAASSAEVRDEAAPEAGGEAVVSGRQAAPYRPNVVIDFCDEFGYVHTISSSVKECACDKDVLVTSFSRDNDIYHSNGLFAAYECLPGTYKARCEVCFADTRTCQPTPCP